MDAAVASGLRVSFAAKGGPVEALRGVDLAVPKGSLFVLLGPNGAGKTTLMRCVTGLVRPTQGTLSVLGSPPPDGSAPAARGSRPRDGLGRLGVLIENPGLYGRLDAREYLAFFGSFYAVPDLPGRIRELCAQFGLEATDRPVAKLSQGNRQKLQLIRSLLHRPELLLWDEPTDHLDPESQGEVLGYLRSYLAQAGATALVATHRLEQMERVASHFGFLRQGRILRAGSREAILDGGAAKARIRFAAPVKREALDLLAAEFALKAEPAQGAGESAVDIAGEDLQSKLARVIKALCARDLPVTYVEPLRAGLPEVYAALMGEG